MEPRIQYAQTADGVSIAFWTLGGGIRVVDIWPSPLNHIQMDWQPDRLKTKEVTRWLDMK